MGGIDSYTKLMLHCDGADASTTFTDASASAHTMAVVGSVEIDTAQSVFGGASGLFAGAVGDYLSTPDSADWYLGGGDFCIDLRARLSASGTDGLWQQFQDANNRVGAAYDHGAGTLTFYSKFAASAEALIHGTFTATAATWYHIALVRKSLVWQWYVDGVALAMTGTPDTSALSDITAPMFIGYYSAGTPTNMTGHIDEFRFSNGSARVDDPTDPLYISSGILADGFTPPIAAYSAPPLSYASFVARASVSTPQTVLFPARAVGYEPTKMFASFPTRSTAIQGNYASFIARNNVDVPQYSTFAARNEARVIRTASFATRNDINTFVNSSFPVRQMAMYAPGWNMYITDKSTDITTFIGFIDAEAAHVLSDVSIAPGTYELEARPIINMWSDTTSAIRTPLTISAGSPTTPVAGVPDIINLTGTNSAGWTRLQWGVSAQPTGSNPRFGVWRGPTPVVLTGAAESVIYYDEQVQTYVLNVRQTASTYFAVLCVAGDVIGTATEVQVLVAASTLAKPTGVFAK